MIRENTLLINTEGEKVNVNEEKCIGCGMCARNCPANCIVGEKKSRHVIDQNKCLKCGQCEKTCKFGAIIKKYFNTRYI